MSKKQCIYWIWTLPILKDFFVTDDWVLSSDRLRELLHHKDIKSWIFQAECGESTDYLHYQGWMQVRSKKRLDEVSKLLPGAHFEPSNGPAAERYCRKVDTRIDGPWMFPYKYMGEDIITKLRDWQQEVVEIINMPVDPRKIYWYWEPNGNMGKSALVKYLAWWHKAVLIGGESADAMYAVAESRMEQVPIFVVDIPRNEGNRVPYQALEQLKNGLGFSAKYKSKTYLAPPAHIFVFANSPPDESKMSADRWVIKRIGEPVIDTLGL